MRNLRAKFITYRNIFKFFQEYQLSRLMTERLPPPVARRVRAGRHWRNLSPTDNLCHSRAKIRATCAAPQPLRATAAIGGCGQFHCRAARYRPRGGWTRLHRGSFAGGRGSVGNIPAPAGSELTRRTEILSLRTFYVEHLLFDQ